METADHDEPVLIDSILDQVLRKIRGGQAFEIEEYCRKYPELADELRLMLPALMMLERPSGDSTAASPPAASHTPIPQDLADFEILSEVGRGAMGVVYEAIQKSLGRRVALKVIFGALDQNAAGSLRFQREAELAAGLHHTNIVPVFEAGESAGFFYYAMQLIEGDNLRQLIASSQNRQSVKTPKSGETILDMGSTDKEQRHPAAVQVLSSAQSSIDFSPTTCARIVLQVAEGLEYAHSRGILHRDIKPSNILLDREGRAWVADFGLAKSSEGTELTTPGDVVGTVRYLAPERFQGQSDQRSDLYALGLTLYELLEGKPAFRETDRAQLIAAILEGSIPTLTATIPRDLATICFKCTQPVPADRYASAGELAADLRRYLDGRPISARPLSRASKLLRWCGRNRRITVLATLVVLAVGVSLGASLWQSQQIQRVSAESQASTLLANSNFQSILKTVDRFCQTVSDDRRVYRKEYQDLRNLLLDSAHNLRTQSAQQVDVPATSKIQLASIFQRLGKMKTSADKLSDSEGFLLQSLNLLLELSPQTLKEQNVAIELAATHRQLAWIYRLMRKREPAVQHSLASQRILEELLESEPLSVEAQAIVKSELAQTFSVYGITLFDMRELDDSVAAVNRSVQLWEEILQADPQNFEVAFALAGQWNRHAGLLVESLKLKDAERAFAESTRLYERLNAQAPQSLDFRFAYAQMLTKKAKWFFITGKPQDAIKTVRVAIPIFEEQHQQFELDLVVQLELGTALRQLADFLPKTDPEKLMLLNRSEQVLSQAVTSDPADVYAAFLLQTTYLALAESLKNKDSDIALEKIDKSIQILDAILKTNPADPRASERRYDTAEVRAEILSQLSRHDEALAEWEIALKHAPAMFVEFAQMKRTRTIARSGQFQLATEQVEEFLNREPFRSRPNRHLFAESAITFAVAAQVVLQAGNDAGSVDLSERYAERAVQLLERFQDLGGNVAESLDNNPDLKVLTDRADCQALLQPTAQPEK